MLRVLMAVMYEIVNYKTLFISDVDICVGLGSVFLSYVFIPQMCARFCHQTCCQYVVLKDLVSNVSIVYLPFVTGMFAVIFTNSFKECVCKKMSMGARIAWAVLILGQELYY